MPRRARWAVCWYKSPSYTRPPSRTPHRYSVMQRPRTRWTWTPSASRSSRSSPRRRKPSWRRSQQRRQCRQRPKKRLESRNQFGGLLRRTPFFSCARLPALKVAPQDRSAMFCPTGLKKELIAPSEIPVRPNHEAEVCEVGFRPIGPGSTDTTSICRSCSATAPTSPRLPASCASPGRQKTRPPTTR